jgi:hypothetical protein
MEKLTSDELTETEAKTAELRSRIETQIAAMLAAGRQVMEDARVAKARSKWLADFVSGKGSGTIQ